MSDLIYDGGDSGDSGVSFDSSTFGNINDSYDGWSSKAAYEAYLNTQNFKKQEQIDWANFEQPNVQGAGWSTSLSGSTFTYNYKTNSNLYHSAFSVDDILSQFDGSAKDALNPYSQEVVYKQTYEQNTNKTTNYYMDNPAYAEFETLVSQMQQVEYQEVYESSKSSSVSLNSDFVADSNDSYSVDRFGNTTLISSLAGDLVDVSSELYDYSLQDTLSSEYNRVDNTDNSLLIEDKKKELDSIMAQYEQAVSQYDIDSYMERYNKAKDAQDKANQSSWNTDFFWATEHAFDAGFGYYSPLSPSQTFNFFNSGEQNDWMAGGNLYDSPRAGGTLFNVTGDMNTVRFLGLEDKNYNPHLDRQLNGMAGLHKMLGVNAGSKNFSIL